MNKRAQQMTLGTIIMIVLGLVVLVFLIYGFSVGWGNFMDKIFNFGGKSNVDTIKSACELAKQRGGTSSYEYSSLNRTVKWGDGTSSEMTCEELESSGWKKPRDKEGPQGPNNNQKPRGGGR